MELRLKANHNIRFFAPNIRYVDAGLMKWFKIEHSECEYPNSLSAFDWEIVPLKDCQIHWKPSKEQLEALEYFISFHKPQANAAVEGWKEFNNLESLYNDIKSL